MTADMQLIPAALLDEAETVVEAEWVRLAHDWDQWEQELAGFLAELPDPRSRPPRSCTTAVSRRPTALAPRRRSLMSPLRRSPAPTVWATQRSPPAATSKPPIQRCSRATEVMP
jgi:hypothetical protein